MSPEEKLRRVRACLAEAGYDPGHVALDGEVLVCPGWNHLPHFVAWKAAAVAGVAERCWPCTRQAGWQWGPPRRPPCGHPVDPFCPEDAEAVS